MASQISPKRILVVDDNSDAADLTAELLQMRGHVSAAVYGGQEAMQKALDFAPDVVLLDLGMGTDGFAVAIALRQRPSLQQPVLIAYTARNDEATKTRALACGFDRHLLKPAKLEVILQIIEQTQRPSHAPASPMYEQAPAQTIVMNGHV